MKEQSDENVKIEANGTVDLTVLVNPEDYAGKRADGHSGMKCSTVVKVGDNIICDGKYFNLKKPSTMSIEVKILILKIDQKPDCSEINSGTKPFGHKRKIDARLLNNSGNN